MNKIIVGVLGCGCLTAILVVVAVVVFGFGCSDYIMGRSKELLGDVPDGYMAFGFDLADYGFIIVQDPATTQAKIIENTWDGIEGDFNIDAKNNFDDYLNNKLDPRNVEGRSGQFMMAPFSFISEDVKDIEYDSELCVSAGNSSYPWVIVTAYDTVDERELKIMSSILQYPDDRIVMVEIESAGRYDEDDNVEMARFLMNDTKLKDDLVLPSDSTNVCNLSLAG